MKASELEEYEKWFDGNVLISEMRCLLAKLELW